ncbi:MAG: RDD family protein [Verrucomicrobia bacterium]|nr:RDD family protein [Verrucomicrobiota bacterium]
MTMALALMGLLSEGLRARAQDGPATPMAHLHEVVQIGRDAVIGPNESVKFVTVINGDVQVDGDVREAVVVVNGNLRVSGRIRGEVVVIGGDLDALPTAILKRPATVIAGKVTQSPGAQMRSDNHIFSADTTPVLKGITDWALQGALWLRPLPPRVPWVWTFPAVFFFLYLLMGLVLPGPTRACVSALMDRPILSYLIGLIALFFLLLLTPLLVILGAVGIGFLLLFAVALGLFFGRMVVVQFVGLQATRELGWPFLHRPIAGLLVGSVVFCLLYMVPFLGLVIWFGMLPMAMGSLLMATGRALRPKRAPQAMSAAVPSDAGAGTSAPTSSLPPAFPALPADAMPPVGFFMRTVATLLDFILIAAVAQAVGLEGKSWMLLWMGYHIALWTWSGATIGGKVIGSMLCERDGSPIQFKTATTRCLAAFLSALPLGLGFIWAAWDTRKQSWHDKLTGVYVVWKRGRQR